MFDFNIPYKNFIFDIGNVILTWDPISILKNILPDCKNYEFYMNNIFKHPDWLEFDRGTLSQDAAVIVFSKRTSLPVEVVKKIMCSVKSSLVPIHNNIRLLEKLHQLGKKLYCLTNMCEDIFLYLKEKYKFWDYFEGIVVS